MHDSSTNSIIHAFGGNHFEVMIWFCQPQEGSPGHYRAFIRVREGAGATLLENAVECPPDSLRELASLARSAATMVAFLEEGGTVEHWCDGPTPYAAMIHASNN